MTGDVEQQRYNLLAYGVERKGLTPPREAIVDRNYSLSFELLTTPRRFNEFDGVVIFQGTFESFQTKRNWTSERYLVHSYERDELDKRKKELQILLQKAGFVCFVLCEPFIDRDGGRNFEGSDLAKVSLNFPSFYRKNFQSRATVLRVIRDEFLRFFELYGAANSHFTNHNDNIDLRVLAQVHDTTVSMVLWDEQFFIPCLLPENTPERVDEFFRLLCDALVATRKKLQVEIPGWVNAFRFESESTLLGKRNSLLAEIQHTDSQLTQFEKYKRILLFDGDVLVDSVGEVLERGFGLKIDRHDELKEDLKILDEEGQPIVFVEIKGTNRGVKREHINQADSHRERASLPADFPAILIMNTHVKNSRSLAEKKQDIAMEQVLHAKKTNVLVLRTYDLLEFLRLYLTGGITRDMVLELLTTSSGWLKVTDQEVKLVTE